MSAALTEQPQTAIDAVREAVKGLRSDTLSYSAMARAAGVGESTFNAWLNDNYNGDDAKIADKVRRWLDSRAKAEEIKSVLPDAPGFVRTSTVESVLGLLAYAQMVPTMGVISGGAGVGKTTAIKHYQASNPNVWLLTGEPSLKSPFAVLSYLAEVLGVNERASDKRSRAIVERLRGTGSLIIVDEAHWYPTVVLDQLRYVFDQAEIGLALLGNAGIYERLEGEGRTLRFAPLFRRIGKRLTILRPLPADIRALVDAWGIDGAEERRVLNLIGAKPGGLGGMTMTLRMAHMLAGGERVTAAHIVQAYRDLNEVPVEGRAS